MMLIDTSYFIALLREKDENHIRACEIAATLGKTATTTENLSELVSYIAKKDGNANAFAVGNKVLDSECMILTTVHEDLKPALELVKKYPKMSMFDAILIITAKRIRAEGIVSFDSDFDRVPSIKRVF